MKYRPKNVIALPVLYVGNPMKKSNHLEKDKTFSTFQQDAINQRCIFCNSTQWLKDTVKHKQIFSSKSLCFKSSVITMLILQVVPASNGIGNVIHLCASRTKCKGIQDERKDVSYIWRKDHSILIFRPNEIKYAALVNPGARNSHA